MRVITGTARGARLATLEGMDVRPTADRVKGSVFNMIQFEIEGRTVLDIFAGSGQLGIEALSRGAKSAVFVDSGAEAIKVIKQNLMHVKLYQSAVVLESDAVSYLRHTKSTFDIAFIDPPYSKGLAEAALPMAAEHMSPQGVIICEVARIDPLPQTAGGFIQTARNNYGKTSVAVYRSKI